MPERLLSMGEVAEYCQVSRVTAHNWATKGFFATFSTPGGHYRVKLSDFRRFLEEYEMPVDPSFFERFQERILVVDDDAAVVELFRRMLVRDGSAHRLVETAADGFEAGRKIATFNPDLVILDLMMPGLDGFSVCERVKSDPETEHIKVLVVTGFGTEEKIERAFQLGADAYLLKPLSPEQLLERVERLLGGEG